MNITRFHGSSVNVISFMTVIKKAWPPWEIFTNLADVQQLYVHISYKEFPPNRTIKVGSTDKNPLTRQVKNSIHCADFHEPHNHSINCGGHCLYRVLTKLEESAERCAKFRLRPTVKQRSKPQVPVTASESLPPGLRISNCTNCSYHRPTSRCILFDGENVSFDASLVIYIYIVLIFLQLWLYT
jgi:hypothetical protein